MGAFEAVVCLGQVQHCAEWGHRRSKATSIGSRMFCQLAGKCWHDLPDNVRILRVLEVLHDKSAHVGDDGGTTLPSRVQLCRVANHVLHQVPDVLCVANQAVSRITQLAPAVAQVSAHVEGQGADLASSVQKVASQILHFRVVWDQDFAHLQQPSQHCLAAGSLPPSHTSGIDRLDGIPVVVLAAQRHKEFARIGPNLMLQRIVHRFHGFQSASAELHRH
mmetsp:Transcript_105077/g.250121  ORF Transcript_105077/g.250121 Transcript_105077/m.250121 type:complete len:220 (-) Transcript_105077:242-901(-)